MMLSELVDVYIAHQNEERPIGRSLSSETRRYYLECVQSYAAYLRREPTIEDLAPERVNEFLAWLLASGRSAYTVKNRRTGLRALMRFAKRQGLTDADSDRLRSVHCDPLDIKGYTSADMQKLLAAAATLRLTQRRTGVSRRVYWTSLLLTLWNCGSRIGDITSIRVDKFEPRGRLWIHEGKTGKSRWHLLHATTRDSIIACLAENPGRVLIWPGYTNDNIYFAFKGLAMQAGVGGTSRFIRRGASSELDRLQPGMGWRFLNHSTPRVFEQHYRCADICEDESLAPPELSVPLRVVG